MHYRLGVGAVIVNAAQHVFVAKRVDKSHGIQMPQGGVRTNEKLKNALYRELCEEIGTKNAIIRRNLLYPLYYDFPIKLSQKIYGGKFIGQKIYWFLLEFQGIDSDINLVQKHQEFIEWEWMPHNQVVNHVVDFKKTMYYTVFEAFSSFFSK